jgi:hypothetical protein
MLIKNKKMVEVSKPSCLEESPEPLYYMYANKHDILGETYKQITTDEELDIAYKVFIGEE